MKKGIILIFSVLFITMLNAQIISGDIMCEDKHTLLSRKPLTGGFIGVTAKGGEINDQEDLWLGGEIATVFGNNLTVGLAGYGLVNSVQSFNLDFDGKILHYQAGYGGLYIEPAIFENSVINMSFPTVLGAGGIGETTIGGVIDELDGFDLEDDDLYYSDVFWVAEPSVALNLNISRWMKLSAGVSYRYVHELDLYDTPDDLLNGVNGNVSLKIGWF